MEFATCRTCVIVASFSIRVAISPAHRVRCVADGTHWMCVILRLAVSEGKCFALPVAIYMLITSLAPALDAGAIMKV